MMFIIDEDESKVNVTGAMTDYHIQLMIESIFNCDKFKLFIAERMMRDLIERVGKMTSSKN